MQLHISRLVADSRHVPVPSSAVYNNGNTMSAASGSSFTRPRAKTEAPLLSPLSSGSYEGSPSAGNSPASSPTKPHPARTGFEAQTVDAAMQLRRNALVHAFPNATPRPRGAGGHGSGNSGAPGGPDSPPASLAHGLSAIRLSFALGNEKTGVHNSGASVVNHGRKQNERWQKGYTRLMDLMKSSSSVANLKVDPKPWDEPGAGSPVPALRTIRSLPEC